METLNDMHTVEHSKYVKLEKLVHASTLFLKRQTSMFELIIKQLDSHNYIWYI